MKDEMVQPWGFAATQLYFAVLLPHPVPGAALGEYSVDEERTVRDGVDHGPWTVTRSSAHPTLSVYLYRRRALVHVPVPEFGSPTFDEAIRWAVSEENLAAVKGALADTLDPAPSEPDLRIMPILVGDLDTGSASQSVHWISEGTTSFHFRMYDASEQRQAIVRVSRHLVVVAGAGTRVRQEVVNLVYEKFLYPSSGHIEAAAVFSFLDGLARYTIPTENSIFLQREFGRFALFLATVQVLVGVWAAVVNDAAVTVLVVAAVSLVALVSISYVALRRVRLVKWN